MNNRLNNWPVILIVAVVGVLFIVWHGENSLFDWIVRLIGLSLVVPGIYVFVSSLKELRDARRRLEGSATAADRAVAELGLGERAAIYSMVVVSVATVAVGLWMIIAPTMFVALLAYLFAALLVIFGIYQLVAIAYFNRDAHFGWYFYAVPAVFIIAGVIILFSSPDTIRNTVALLTGILLIAAAVNALVQNVAIIRLNRQARKSKRIEENVD